MFNNTVKKEDNEMKSIQKKYILEISNGDRFLLSGDKYLVGNLESADIQLSIDGIDGPFLLLVRDGDDFDIVSLRNDLDITVNNKLIQGIEKNVAGKQISCGNLELVIKSNIVTIVKNDSLAELPPRFTGDSQKNLYLQNLQKLKTVQETSELQLVNDEYCNIIFNDEYIEKLDYHPFDLKKKIDYPNELVDGSAKLDESTEKRLYIEIVVMTRGRVVFIDQVEYSSGIYELSWGVEQNTPLLAFKNEKVEIITPLGFEKEVIEEQKGSSILFSKSYLDGKVYSLFNSPSQIFIREVTNNKKPKPYVFFEAEKEVLKEIGKVAAALFIPFLLLLFLDTTLPEKKKEEVAIIYKRLKKEPKKKIRIAKKKIEKTAHTAQKQSKQSDQPKQKKKVAKSSVAKVAMPMKTEKPKVLTKTPKVTLKNRASAKRVVKSPISLHKTNKTTHSKSNKVAKKAPVKTYKLELKSSFKSLFGNQKSASSVKVSRRGNTANFAGGESRNSNRLTGLNSRVGTHKAVGSIGGSVSGQANGAYSAGGLGDKKGYYATLSRKRTVVMGSMDPELVRRLLREHLSQFRYCYQKEIINNKAANSMTADLKFTITPSGGVANVSMANNNRNFSKQGVRCIHSVLNLIDFPRPKGGGRVDIQQPLNFTFSKRNI